MNVTKDDSAQTKVRLIYQIISGLLCSGTFFNAKYTTGEIYSLFGHLW